MGHAEGRSWLKSGLEVSKIGWYFSQELGSLVMQGVTDRMTPDVEDMRRSVHLKDAEIGLADKLRGRDKDIPELEYFGEAEMLVAVVKADNDPDVPVDDVETIADMIAGAGIEPPLSPLVDDETAQKADRLVREYRSVVNMPSGYEPLH